LPSINLPPLTPLLKKEGKVGQKPVLKTAYTETVVLVVGIPVDRRIADVQVPVPSVRSAILR